MADFVDTITRIKISKVLSGVIFWVPVIVIYFKSFGLGDIQAYSLIAFYGLANALLEFPTGVVSDFYSQAASLRWGYSLIAVGLIIICFPVPLVVLYLAQFLSAAGTSLASGSDTALLSQYSTDLTKDFKQNRLRFQLALVFSAFVGAFLYAIWPILPVALTAVAHIINVIVLWNVRDKTSTNAPYSGNLFSKAKDGVVIALRNPMLRIVILFSGLLLGFEMSIKYIFNDFFLALGLDVVYHGIIFSSITFATVVGVSLFKTKVSKRNILALASFPLALLLLGISRSLPISTILLLGIFFARGLNDTFMELVMVNETPRANTASVLSLKNLLVRLFSGFLTFVFGLILSVHSIFWLWGLFGIVFAIFTSTFLYSYRNLMKSRGDLERSGDRPLMEL